MSTRCDGPGVVALCCGTFVACGSKFRHCCWDRNFTRPTAPMLIFIPTFAVSTLLLFHLHTSYPSTTNSSSLASHTTNHLSCRMHNHRHCWLHTHHPSLQYALHTRRAYHCYFTARTPQHIIILCPGWIHLPAYFPRSAHCL